MEITDTLWMAWSNKGDIDEAWDEAKQASLALFGSYFPATALYASDFTLGSVARPLGYWWRHGQGLSGLHALALARPRDWAQRSVRVRYQGTDVTWPEGSKNPLRGDELSDEVILDVLAHEGISPEAGEMITVAIVSASRARKKAVVTRYPAPSERVFELRADGVVISEDPKSGPLVSAARGLIKDHSEMSVWARSGRSGGSPLVRITSEVLSATATLRITLGRQKDPESVAKIGGWFFVGPRDLLSLYSGPVVVAEEVEAVAVEAEEVEAVAVEAEEVVDEGAESSGDD
jgi:hypothetical protein